MPAPRPLGGLGANRAGVLEPVAAPGKPAVGGGAETAAGESGAADAMRAASENVPPAAAAPHPFCAPPTAPAHSGGSELADKVGGKGGDQNLGALKARLSSLAAARGGAGGGVSAAAATPGAAARAATSTAPLSARPPPAIGRAATIAASSSPAPAVPAASLSALPADAAAATAAATAVAAAAVSLTDLAARTVLDGELAGACEAALASLSPAALRACLLAVRARASTLADAAARFEREVEGRVEAAGLAAEAAARDARADAARAEHAAAVAAAAHKAAAAAAAVDLDAARCDAARSAREVERLAADRDRAREGARTAEAAAVAAAASERAAVKDAARAGREADGARADAEAAASGARAAAAAAEAAAEAERVSAAERVFEADARAAAAEAEASRLRGEVEAARGEVEDGRAAVDAAGAATEAAEAAAAAAAAAAADSDARAAAAEQAAEDARDAIGRADERAGEAEAEAEAARHAAAAADERAAGAAQAVAAADARAAAAEAKAASAVAGTEDADTRIAAATARAAAAEGALAGAREAEAAAKRRAAANDALAAGAAAEVEAARAGTRAAITARDAAVATSTDATQKLARVEGELAALQDAIGGALGAGEGGADQAGMVRRLVGRVGGLEAALGEAATERRRLHNALVELKGNIRVFCRIRPGAPADGPPVVAPAPDGLGIKLVSAAGTAGSSAGAPAKPHAFAFDRAFGPGASQAAVFEEVSDLVQSALDGYSVCLFSYGQTGAGKTWTMSGGAGPDAAGIIPRAVAKVLEAARRAGPGGWAYTFEASFVEVYNEGLRDLLHPEAPSGGGRLGDPNAIQHSADGHTRVAGATRVPVTTSADIESLLATSAAARSTAATAMNDASSRSHSVFMLAIAGVHEGAGVSLKGALNLVDLAGSERLGRSLAEGDRAREACAINKSLSALGDVFAALASKAPHIPYRNSKLTHLLQPCLGGSGKTLMFVNVAPDEASSGETLCSLRFAAKVNGVETAAKGGAKRAVGKLEGATGAGGGVGAAAKRRAVGGPPAKK
jgi:kinesin family protein C1